jgi:hypothetical protein
MSLEFSDEELENYMRKMLEAEKYLNFLIRKKRVEQLKKDGTTFMSQEDFLNGK